MPTAMSRFSMPDHDPEQTKKLHEAIRSRKVRALHSLLKDHNGSRVYVDGLAFDLARSHMPAKVGLLGDHMRKHFYG